MTYNLTVTITRSIGPGQRSSNSVKTPVVITYPNGEVILTEGISEAAEVTGLSQSCITYRLHNPRPPQLIPPPGYTSIRQVPGYTSYKAAHNRCTNTTNKEYAEYGGRGIQFKFKNYLEFYNEVGERPGLKYSIDRIDNDGNYEPGNVRWATATQQVHNRRPYRSRGCTYIITPAIGPQWIGHKNGKGKPGIYCCLYNRSTQSILFAESLSAAAILIGRSKSYVAYNLHRNSK